MEIATKRATSNPVACVAENADPWVFTLITRTWSFISWRYTTGSTNQRPGWLHYGKRSPLGLYLFKSCAKYLYILFNGTDVTLPTDMGDTANKI